MQIDLEGQRALVTGGKGGIGRAISLALGKARGRVAINYVSDESAAQDLAQRISSEGREAIAIEADISDPAQVKAMFERLDSEWGGLDILVNNAGIQGQRTPSWKIEPESWRQIVNVNLFGTFLCSREALQRMVPAKAGVILNITSVHQLIPWSGYSAYTVSKAGVEMLTKTLAQEAAPDGIRVLALAPGAIKTPINEDVRQDPDKRDDLLSKIPLNRIGEPEDIAQMALVLVSDAANYVTGTTLYVDGGMTDYPDFAHGK